MYFLTAEHSMDAAHFLSGYNGKCSNIHGHRWKVIVSVKEEELKIEGPERGMVFDFKDLKDIVKEEVDFFDHSLIVEEGTLKENTVRALLDENFRIEFVKFRPTAESFAKYFFDRIESKGYRVNSVKVYETPNNCAVYTKGESVGI
ncbi:6-carboxytetrahydropterin synthase QueD [Fusobacterium sp. MFO224]|uniref:6-carboxytetrahydropterin synthase QueD n=1 Tax=Fusobacterium sp. MFO224 TaxID=3378070 RepID=UPI0038519666